tara:strand:+ start:289 stop:507 length:219 start_codon:yes stop_codon:yes gene_type:complete
MTKRISILNNKERGASRDDCRYSGFMNLNETSMRESIYMINMTPQLPAFNRGIRMVLESDPRQLIIKKQDAY